MSTLIREQTVITFGRERTAHDWRVTVVGDDTTGYRAQPVTRCGRTFDDATKTVPGFVTCATCLDARQRGITVHP